MDAHRKLLLGNKAWVADKLSIRADYFESRADTQTPQFLWIGCADSRVPAEDVTGCEPGELFVHRNIANLVVHTDFSMLSVLQYAVEVLKVKHVIVCGHYGCGGVKAAMGQQHLGLINKWLRHIKDTYRTHRREIEMFESQPERCDRLVEISVREQVQNIAETSMVQIAWKNEQRPLVHGWVYDMRTGMLKEIATMGPGAELDPIYRYNL